MKQVTIKDTKQTIMDAYNEAMAKLKEVEAGKLDPVKETETKRNAEVVAKAEVILQDKSIKDIINDIRTGAATSLEEIVSKIEVKGEDYNTVVEAITIKKGEMNELFGFEKEALNLAALVNTKEEIARKYSEQRLKEETEHKAMLEEVRKTIKAEKDLAKDEIETLKEEAEKEREREEEEWYYNFNRKKLAKENELADDLASKVKKHNDAVDQKTAVVLEREKAVAEREAAILSKEAYIAELEARVNAFPGELATAVAEAKESGRKEAEKITAIKEAAVKRELEADKKILENKIDMLEAARVVDKDAIFDLQGKLDSAYAKIEAISNKAVESARPVYQTGYSELKTSK